MNKEKKLVVESSNRWDHSLKLNSSYPISIISLLLQLRDLEEELEEERKQRTAAANVKRRLESELSEFQHQFEQANKVKEDAVRQMKKYQNQVKDLSRELDDSRMGRDESAARYKEVDRKLKNMEAELAAAQDVSSSLFYVWFMQTRGRHIWFRIWLLLSGPDGKLRVKEMN